MNNSSRVPIDPQTALSLGSETGAARYSLLSQLAALRANQALVRGQYQTGVAAARGQMRTDVVGAANGAAERGIIGSSVDLRGRAAAHTAFATNRVQLQQQRAQGILGIKQQMIGAQSQYQMQMADIAARQQLAQTLASNQSQLDAAQRAAQQDALSQQSTYYQNYLDLLQQMMNQRNGNTPRHRNGVDNGPPLATAPGYNKPLY